MACILESSEIKKKWPVFNQAQKRWEDTYGFFMYEDQKGFRRIIIDKNRKRMNPVHTFHYLADGQAMLRNLVRKYNLCPKFCFIQSASEPCNGRHEGYCYGACEHKEDPVAYNERVEQALHQMKQQPSFVIIDKGINGSDRSCILVEEGKFYGMGYVQENFEIKDLESLRPLLTRYRENSFIRNIVYGYASRFPDKVKLFETQAVSSH
jgi:DNA polymerase-3 subunit epsilon